MNTNVLILGKTGVGKSTLINYIYGQKIVIGKAGTAQTAKGFHKQNTFNYNGLDITIYDSWGLEADKTEDWYKTLDSEIENTNSKLINEWFHIALYCIDAKASRLDNFEKNKIIKRLLDNGVRLIFVLTKWDLCSDEEKSAAINLIKENYSNYDYVNVCSIKKKLRDGNITEPTGREDLFKKMCLNLRDNLTDRTFANAEKNLNTYLINAERDILDYFDQEAGYFGVFTYYGDEIKEKIKNHSKECYEKYMKKLFNEVDTNIDNIDKMCQEVINIYCNKYVDLSKFRSIIYEEIDSIDFEEWDNSWADDFSTIIATIFTVGIFQIGKKDYYKKQVATSINKVSDSLREKIHLWINKLIHEENKVNKGYRKYINDSFSSYQENHNKSINKINSSLITINYDFNSYIMDKKAFFNSYSYILMDRIVYINQILENIWENFNKEYEDVDSVRERLNNTINLIFELQVYEIKKDMEFQYMKEFSSSLIEDINDETDFLISKFPNYSNQLKKFQINKYNSIIKLATELQQIINQEMGSVYSNIISLCASIQSRKLQWNEYINDEDLSKTIEYIISGTIVVANPIIGILILIGKILKDKNTNKKKENVINSIIQDIIKFIEFIDDAANKRISCCQRIASYIYDKIYQAYTERHQALKTLLDSNSISKVYYMLIQNDINKFKSSKNKDFNNIILSLLNDEKMSIVLRSSLF